MAAKQVLNKIREDLDALVGEKIRVKANRGRKKVDQQEGVLEKTYPHIFLIRVLDQPGQERLVSYSYTDILTSSVELEVHRETEEIEGALS